MDMKVLLEAGPNRRDVVNETPTGLLEVNCAVDLRQLECMQVQK
jgi:hypothetical protein